MQLKHAVCTAAVALPLLLAGAGPSAAQVDVGFGSPYYDSPYYGSPYGGPYDGYYGPDYYGLATYDDDEVFLGAQVDVDDDMDVVVEPSAAAPAPCVKTNVKNLKNACSM